MNLETSNGPQGTATAARIQELIQDDSQRGDYLILSQSEQVYLQATGTDNEFHAEYRDAPAGQHFVLIDPINGNDLAKLMLRYLQQEADWQSQHKWQSLG